MRDAARTLALLILGACVLPAQQSPQAAAVRRLNDTLLQVYSQLLQATPSQAVGLQSQAAAVIGQRAGALSALVQVNASQALSLAFAPDLLAKLAAAAPQSASQLESYGTWQGAIEYSIFDDASLSTRRTEIRMAQPGGPLEVYFSGAEPSGLKSGDLLRASGMRVQNRLAAAGGTVQGTTLAAGACVPTGSQKAAVLLVTFPGVPAPSISQQTISDIFQATSGRSVDLFWKETSYNQTSVTADIYGWYTLDALYTCDQTSQMRAAAIAAADPYINFQNYNRLFIVFPTPNGCSFAGAASLGCTSLSSPGDGTFTSSYAYLVSNYMTTRDQGVELTTHEGGHNLGFHHARSRDFGSDAIGPLGTAGTLSEYGDVFSTMGYWNFGHYAAPHKVKAGWLSNGPNYQVVQSNGTFSLQPVEVSPPGLQALKVQRGTGNNAWVWVEYRQPIGNYDSTLNSQVFSGALIHYEDSTTTCCGAYTDLVDYTTATSSFSDPALAAGQTWVDPYSNLSIFVQSASSSGVTVAVNYGAVTCAPANPSVALSPANPSVAAGSSVTYTVTVTNNSSSACSSTTYSLTSAQPIGWASSLGSTSLTISPGQSASTTLTETPPVGATPATYSISLTAASGSYSGTGTANCSVTSAPPPLTVSETVGSTSFATPTYAVRSTVPIAAKVLSGTSPAVGASVVFTLTKPDGTTTKKTATADSTGTAAWSYKVSPNAPQGTYTSVATATYSGQTASSSPAYFSVQ